MLKCEFESRGGFVCFVFYVFCFNATDRNKLVTSVRFNLH